MKRYFFFVITIFVLSCQSKTNTTHSESATAHPHDSAATAVSTAVENAETPSSTTETTEDASATGHTETPKTSTATPAPTQTQKKDKRAVTPIVSTKVSTEATTVQPPTFQPVTNNAPAPVAVIQKEEAKVEKPVAAAIPDHKSWDRLLSQNVSSNGKVNYKGFISQKNTLDAYLDELASNAPTKQWSRNEQLAFWINAYNAYTVKLIIDNYPVKKITDLEGGKPWDKKWIDIGGKKYSLNNIENDIIRPQFNEPRIHFAVNCAAKSCPPLMNGAFMANKLTSQLENQATDFINNTAYNQIDGKKATVSKIFDWYGKDFGDLNAYLAKYAKAGLDKGAKVTFNEYDWSLNQ